MIHMIILYAIFIVGGLLLFNKRSKMKMKETIAFVGVTTIGAALWGSIIMHHPLDVNDMIAWLIDRLR